MDKKSKLVSMSNYYNLRFGYCDSESESDFIDNIKGSLNIHIALGEGELEQMYLLIYHNKKFLALKESSLFDNLGDLAKSISNLEPHFSEKLAKGLILSAYDREDYGINAFSPDYEEFYFEARESDDVQDYTTPCYFAVGSLTEHCGCEVDLNSGEISLNGEKIDNLEDFYGYLDEDDTWVIGVKDYTKLH